MINGHPYAVRVYERLRSQGTAPPLPREYGLRVISEALYALDHIRLLETQQPDQEQKP